MTVKKEYYSGGPMQYFREGYETKKKMMLEDLPKAQTGWGTKPKRKRKRKYKPAGAAGGIVLNNRENRPKNNKSNSSSPPCTTNAGCGSRAGNKSMRKKLKKVR